MIFVKVSIERFISDNQPGWVELKLIDAWGREWIFYEKVPVISLEKIEENSNYPQQGKIACQIIKRWKDLNGCEIISIDTNKPWCVWTVEDNYTFDVFPEQLMDLDWVRK